MAACWNPDALRSPALVATCLKSTQCVCPLLFIALLDSSPVSVQTRSTQFHCRGVLVFLLRSLSTTKRAWNFARRLCKRKRKPGRRHSCCDKAARKSRERSREGRLQQPVGRSGTSIRQVEGQGEGRGQRVTPNFPGEQGPFSLLHCSFPCSPLRVGAAGQRRSPCPIGLTSASERPS